MSPTGVRAGPHSPRCHRLRTRLNAQEAFVDDDPSRLVGVFVAETHHPSRRGKGGALEQDLGSAAPVPGLCRNLTYNLVLVAATAVIAAVIAATHPVAVAAGA